MNADGVNKAAGEALKVPESDAGKPKRGSRRERRRARRMVEPSLRKSCDMCHVQKRKCEGDGKGVCRRCARLGHHEHCVYSSRTRRIRKRGDSPATATEDAVSTSSSATTTTTPTGTTSTSTSTITTTSVAQASSEKQQMYDGGDGAGMVARRFLRKTQMVKRFRLCASTATGLVGMQENVLLKDFFSCLGFLPITSQSVIREAIVRILARGGEQEEMRYLEGPQGAAAAAAAGNELVPCGDVSSTDIFPAGSSNNSDLSVCSFWCAVALGGLVQGRPVESVERYFRMARDGLNTFSGSPTIELAQAWTLLAHTYGFLGNMDGFQECLRRASVTLRNAQKGISPNALPMGLVEIIEHVEEDERHTGTASIAEVDGFCRREVRPQNIHAAATEAEMFLFHMQSYNLLEQTMYRCFTSGSPDGAGAPWSLAPEAIAELVHDCFAPFERLEHAVDSRPHIQEGIGGVMINSMIMIAKFVKNDVTAARERLTRVFDVFTRYPGLCRFLIGEHALHIIAAGLAASDDPVSRRLYERLRGMACYAGNHERLPPFDEWAGIPACCEYFACRAVGTLISEGRLFLPPSSSSPFAASAGEPAPRVVALGELQSDHFPSTTATYDETIPENTLNVSPAGLASALLQAEGAGGEELSRDVYRPVGESLSELTESPEFLEASSGQHSAIAGSSMAPYGGALPSLAAAFLSREVPEATDEHEMFHPLPSLCSMQSPRVYTGSRPGPFAVNGDGDISMRQVGVIEAVAGAKLETAHSGVVTSCAEQALTDCGESSVRPHDVNGDGVEQISLNGVEPGLDAELSPRDALGTPNWLDVTHAML